MSLCSECKIENRENKFRCLTQEGGIASCIIGEQNYHKKIFVTGTMHWLKDGKLHRNKKPAVIWVSSHSGSNGSKFWYQDGKYHREEGPAQWTQSGEFQDWFMYGLRHRLDGPAVEHSVSGLKEWWIKGAPYSEEEWKIMVAKKDSKPMENKLIFALLLIPVILLGLWIRD